MTSTEKEFTDQRTLDQPEIAKHDGLVIVDELLTIEDAAKRLKILPLELRRLLQAKKLPAIELVKAQQWRISATALKKFMDDAAKGE